MPPVEFAPCACIRHTERLAEAGIEPSGGRRGDGCDSALAETLNGLYPIELTHRRAPRQSVGSSELAAVRWVRRFNHG